MDELERARIRVYRNDPAGPGRAARRLRSAPLRRRRARGPSASRAARPTRSPTRPTRREFLHWQLASALERGKRLWADASARAAAGSRDRCCRPCPSRATISTPTTTAARCASSATRDARTGAIVQSGDSVDVATHEQGHAVLDALRPDLWDAPHFEVAAFHEAFGDLAAIFVALAEPPLAVARRRGDRRRPGAVESRLAPGRGARRRPCATATATDAAMPGRCATRSTPSATSIRRRCPTRRPPPCFRPSPTPSAT